MLLESIPKTTLITSSTRCEHYSFLVVCSHSLEALMLINLSRDIKAAEKIFLTPPVEEDSEGSEQGCLVIWRGKEVVTQCRMLPSRNGRKLLKSPLRILLEWGIVGWFAQRLHLRCSEFGCLKERYHMLFMRRTRIC